MKKSLVFLSVAFCALILASLCRADTFSARPDVSNYTYAVEVGTWCGKALAERRLAIGNTNGVLPLCDAQHDCLLQWKQAIAEKLPAFADTTLADMNDKFMSYLQARRVWEWQEEWVDCSHTGRWALVYPTSIPALNEGRMALAMGGPYEEIVDTQSVITIEGYKYGDVYTHIYTNIYYPPGHSNNPEVVTNYIKTCFDATPWGSLCDNGPGSTNLIVWLYPNYFWTNACADGYTTRDYGWQSVELVLNSMKWIAATQGDLSFAGYTNSQSGHSFKRGMIGNTWYGACWNGYYEYADYNCQIQTVSSNCVPSVSCAELYSDGTNQGQTVATLYSSGFLDERRLDVFSVCSNLVWCPGLSCTASYQSWGYNGGQFNFDEKWVDFNQSVVLGPQRVPGTADVYIGLRTRASGDDHTYVKDSQNCTSLWFVDECQWFPPGNLLVSTSCSSATAVSGTFRHYYTDDPYPLVGTNWGYAYTYLQFAYFSGDFSAAAVLKPAWAYHN